METILKAENQSYHIGNSNYEITREFNLQKSLKDIILEKITSTEIRLHN